MTSAEKWNLIVERYKHLYTCPESSVQEDWEMYCTDLFDYKRILNEIDSQRHLTIGSGSSIIPDIILRTEGKDILDIELKQYNLPFNETFEKQLISYLNQTHLSVGMIVCNKIYLYYYEYATFSISKIEIPFVEDEPAGIALMEIITKSSFSAEKIRDYIFERVKYDECLKEIKKCVTNDWVKETVKEKLLENYSETDIENALEGYSFRVVLPIVNPPKNPLIVSYPKTPIDGNFTSQKDFSPVFHKWCERKGAENEIDFLSHKSGKKLTRFTTADLDAIIPYQEGVKSGWGDGHFYCYEIYYRKNTFRMKLVFNNINTPDVITEIFNRISIAINKSPQKENWEWWTVFSTPCFVCNENTTPEEIFNALDQQFAQVRENVIRLLRNFN